MWFNYIAFCVDATNKITSANCDIDKRTSLDTKHQTAIKRKALLSRLDANFNHCCDQVCQLFELYNFRTEKVDGNVFFFFILKFHLGKPDFEWEEKGIFMEVWTKIGTTKTKNPISIKVYHQTSKEIKRKRKKFRHFNFTWLIFFPNSPTKNTLLANWQDENQREHHQQQKNGTFLLSSAYGKFVVYINYFIIALK